jgi:septum formation protein
MGKTHVFVTAVNIVLMKDGVAKKTWEKTVKTKVTFRKLSPVEVDSYITRFDFTRFAAAYALNEAPWDLVTKIDGSYTNVIGLPFEVLLPILRQLKIIL